MKVPHNSSIELVTKHEGVTRKYVLSCNALGALKLTKRNPKKPVMKDSIERLDKLLQKYDVPASKLGLKKVSRLYTKNFKLMKQFCSAVDVENDLNDLCTLLQKKLGVYMHNPCPIKSSRDCSECTGYYYTDENTHKKFMAENPDAKKCILFGYSMNGVKHEKDK